MTCIAGVAKSHEFWIDPVSHQVENGAVAEAHIRVGMQFDGSSFSYLPQNFRRFDYAFTGDMRPVEGVIGDRPAFRLEATENGLLLVVHETTDQYITWKDFQDFVGFVEHKDAEWVLEEHAAKGFAEDGTREAYSRYAKSLIAVGDGAGSDREVGLLTEIVALENPYTGETGDGVDVRVLYEGKPRADAQLEVFEKSPEGAVEIFKLHTDERGEVTVPVKPGNRYMLDSVVLRPPSDALVAERGVQWESLWANLTFAVPE